MLAVSPPPSYRSPGCLARASSSAAARRATASCPSFAADSPVVKISGVAVASSSGRTSHVSVSTSRRASSSGRVEAARESLLLSVDDLLELLAPVPRLLQVASLQIAVVSPIERVHHVRDGVAGLPQVSCRRERRHVGRRDLPPHSALDEDVRRHVTGVRDGRRDLRVAARRVQRDRRVHRVVEGVDHVVGGAGMVRAASEDVEGDGAGAHVVAQVVVAQRLGRGEQRQARRTRRPRRRRGSAGGGAPSPLRKRSCEPRCHPRPTAPRPRRGTLSRARSAPWRCAPRDRRRAWREPCAGRWDRGRRRAGGCSTSDWPQYGIAKPGSIDCAASNSAIACFQPKLWSAATPRRKWLLRLGRGRGGGEVDGSDLLAPGTGVEGRREQEQYGDGGDPRGGETAAHGSPPAPGCSEPRVSSHAIEGGVRARRGYRRVPSRPAAGSYRLSSTRLLLARLAGSHRAARDCRKAAEEHLHLVPAVRQRAVELELTVVHDGADGGDVARSIGGEGADLTEGLTERVGAMNDERERAVEAGQGTTRNRLGHRRPRRCGATRSTSRLSF